MPNLISEEKLNEIKNLANIVDVISTCVNLKQAGKNYVGLCPFHPDTKPSFAVSPEKQIYHCFGCGAGGNVFNFVMRYHNLSFFEAVRELARRYGVILPLGNRSSAEQEQNEIRSKLFFINRLAAEHYQEILRKDSQGEKALIYLKNRAITPEVVSQYRLGYAKRSWNDMTSFLRRNNVPLDLAEKAGLVVRKKDGNCYDRFRDRIIFPIIDVHSEVIGFGGRVLDDSLPKYINSPETPVYHKSYCLYGLDVAKDYIRKDGYTLIVEGYFDLLTLHSHGIRNVVSTMGTALTRGQARRIKGYADKTVIVFDSDQAGLKAASRSLSVFLEEGLEAKILVLPEGFDPDDYLLEFGGHEFEKVLKGAVSLFEFFMNRIINGFDASVEGKIGVLKELTPVLTSVQNPVERSLYIRKVAETLRVDESIIKKAVWSLQRNQSADIDLDRIQTPSFDKKIIQFLLSYPQYFPNFLKEGAIDDLEDEQFCEIGSCLRLLFQETGQIEVSTLVQRLEDPKLCDIVTGLALEDLNDQQDVMDDVANDIINFLMIRRKKKKARALLDRIKHDESNIHLLNELNMLLSEKKELMTMKG